MVFFKWTKDLELGFKKIDEQHKQFIGIINRAYEAKLDKDKKIGNEILNELIEFTRVHFTTEEKYFEKCNYSGAGEHIAEHIKLTEKVLRFKDNFDSGKCNCGEFLEFLKEWVEKHLKTMDKKYVETLKECGVK